MIGRIPMPTLRSVAINELGYETIGSGAASCTKRRRSTAKQMQAPTSAVSDRVIGLMFQLPSFDGRRNECGHLGGTRN
jgi:hypothetical protein